MVGAAVNRTERGLAELAVLTLRDNGVPDHEIVSDYTTPRPRADRAYEEQYEREFGVSIVALRVKSWMRKLVMQ